MALETGDKLGLCFGGTTPWDERDAARELLKGPRSEVPPALKELERGLGYHFQGHGELLLQAVTHRSYTAATSYCYERLE
jgi:endoribonuclease Dicer